MKVAHRSKWTIRVESLSTRLRVGVYEHEREPQVVLVNLAFSGIAESMPDKLSECFDYEPICNWITREWPNSMHTPLLETRVNELFDHVFAGDFRVLEVKVGLSKPDAWPRARFVGVERELTRFEYEDQHRAAVEVPSTDADEAGTACGIGNGQLPPKLNGRATHL